MAQVTFPAEVGGNGSTYSDTTDPVTGLAGFGYATKLIGMFQQFIAVANFCLGLSLSAANRVGNANRIIKVKSDEAGLQAVSNVYVSDNGKVAIGPAQSTGAHLQLRNDAIDATTVLAISNRAPISTTNYPACALLFDAYRDVASPSYVGGMWISGTGSSFNDYDLVFGVAPNGSAALPPARARLTSSGAMVVGDSANNSGHTDRLWITSPNKAAHFHQSGGTGGSSSMVLSRLVGGSVLENYIGTQYCGGITVSGSSTSFLTSSDYRLKIIDGPVIGSGGFIDALQPVRGTWKADGSPFVGFLAHDFQVVSPTSVTGTKDEVDKDGNPVYQAMQASSPEVMANIVAELQSLRSRVAVLEAL